VEEPLNKCPFCGSEAEIYSVYNACEDEFDVLFGVKCEKRDCRVRTDLYYSASDAKKEWNELRLDRAVLH